ncbi:hypothetical protein [Kitasatospora sp. NPDC088346]|uniref:hypothetical protein n=1 Tax=Kitasatospora sp. NPDC088346 TaxID=3364073 RepID=UPI003804EECF
MGVLTDYFRAADAATVVERLERTDAGPPVGLPRAGAGDAAVDGVEAKGVDPTVVLGRLVAAIRRIPWDTDLVKDRAVWPAVPQPGPQGPQGEDDPWATGPWVFELDTAVRDCLAAVDDTDVPAIVGRWAQAEEFHGAPAEALRPTAEALIGLARRARAAGDRLYCWVCL